MCFRSLLPHCPRSLPRAGVTPGLVYFIVYMTILVFTLVYFRVADDRWYLVVGPGLLWAVAALGLCVLFAISVGLWTSVWAARARDVRFTLRYVLRFWFYLTPVISRSTAYNCCICRCDCGVGGVTLCCTGKVCR